MPAQGRWQQIRRRASCPSSPAFTETPAEAGREGGKAEPAAGLRYGLMRRRGWAARAIGAGR